MASIAGILFFILFIFYFVAFKTVKLNKKILYKIQQ